MQKKAPNKVLSPIVIAGITIGFLASAYKYIFAAKKRTEIERNKQQLRNDAPDQKKSV
jgi:hypothetical protein